MPDIDFELRGEMLHMPPGQGFSIYSIAAVLPLLAAKQRPTHPNDWMTSDASPKATSTPPAGCAEAKVRINASASPPSTTVISAAGRQSASSGAAAALKDGNPMG